MDSNVTWGQYQVFDNESLQAIAIKFDASVELIKRKNKIRDSSELWNGRTILVPNPTQPTPAPKRESNGIPNPDPKVAGADEDDEKDPENVGFIKLDAFRLRVSSDRIVALAKVDIAQELSGVLLITPSAVMFDPTNPTTADDGLILPMGEVKRAALYHINNNKSQAWLQVSGASVVAYFGIESGDTAPLLRCLQRWSAAKNIATPALPRTASQSGETPNKPEPNSADFALCTDSSEMGCNEEFFSSVETEWQIESGSFAEPFTKLELTDIEPKMVSEMPEMSTESSILAEPQICRLNGLMPPRCIGARWVLKYSTRRNGTSMKTLYRQVAQAESPNLCIIKTCCGSIIGALASHPLRPSDHFFGSGETFLFRFPAAESETNFQQFGWSGSNSFFIRCDKDQLVFGSSEGNYAIWIEGSLLRGTSKPTQTFNNPTLTHHKDFRIETVEVWTFSE